MHDYSCEVVVVGGGVAGIAAALELLERGRRVLLLDRDGPEGLGGLARESFGGMFFAGSPEQRRRKIEDSPERAWADWQSYAEFGPDDRWPRAWAEAYVGRCIPEVYDWLRAYGVRFLPMPVWIERGESRPGNSVPRFHIVWGTGRELAGRLAAALQSHPRRHLVEMRFSHRVERLELAGGRIAGCSGVLETDGTPFAARAERVIVAAGGINGDLERVRAHWHPDWGRPPDIILNGAHPFADGRLHDAVAAVGGRVTHLDKMWNYASGVRHWRPRRPAHGLSLVPAKSALWLNWRGRRIGPPPLVGGFDTRHLVTAICAEERAYSWQILNRRIALRELAISGAEFNPAIRDKRPLAMLRELLLGNRWLVDEVTRHCPDVVVARTLPELAQRMNALQGDDAVDAAMLEETVQRYDAAAARGAAGDDEQLRRIALLRAYRGDRLRIARRQTIMDEGALPLIAIREHIVSRKSLGGAQTDLSGRVLDGDGLPIVGLYAAGEAAGFGGGGMHGLRALEGTFLGGCIFSGRIAGRAAAGEN